MSKKSFKFSPKACHKCKQRERERERERSPPPKHRSIFALSASPTSTCQAEFAVLCVPFAVLALIKFVMLNFVAVPLNFVALCRFVAKLATPCCALPNLQRPATLHCAPKAHLATPHRTLNFRPKHHALGLAQQVFAVEF